MAASEVAWFAAKVALGDRVEAGQPLIAYRMPPKFIIKGLQKPLGLKMRFETFRSPEAGEKRLNELLAAGQLVGMQTSVFWLPYMPEDLRFHFNAHNVLAYGRDATSGGSPRRLRSPCRAATATDRRRPVR